MLKSGRNYDNTGTIDDFKLKGAATDMRYYARSKFFRSQVHKKNFSLI